jgi:hypothetical protein
MAAGSSSVSTWSCWFITASRIAGAPARPGHLDCCAVAPAEVLAFRQEFPVRHARMMVTDGADQLSRRRVPADRVDDLVFFREAHPSRLLGHDP